MNVDVQNENNLTNKKENTINNNGNEINKTVLNEGIYVNNTDKMNNFNVQEKQYLNYQLPSTPYTYTYNNQMNGIQNTYSSVSSLFNNNNINNNNNTRPELMTMNLYDPSIYENTTYNNNNMSSSVNFKKEDEVLNSKNDDMSRKYSNVNKGYPMNQNMNNLSNEYYGNSSNSSSYMNNSIFSSDISNSMDIIYNDYNGQMASKVPIKDSEDSLIKDDVDKWVKFPLENDMSNISSLVYMINKDNKNKSKGINNKIYL